MVLHSDEITHYCISYIDGSLMCSGVAGVGITLEFPYYTYNPKSVDAFFFCGYDVLISVVSSMEDDSL